MKNLKTDPSVDYRSAPVRDAKLLPVDLEVERKDDGCVYVQSRIPLRDYEANIPADFAKKAEEMGDAAALVKRTAIGTGEWQATSYRELKSNVDAAAQWLLDNAPKGRPLLLMSDNTPSFSVITFAAWSAGIPVCPVSLVYGALGGDFGRLKHVISKIKPGIIFTENTKATASALDALDLGDAVIVTGEPDGLEKPAVAYRDILKTEPTDAVAQSINALKATDTAAYMLTSGSTGLPKLVVITFDNLAANSAQCMQTVGEAAGWDDVMLDWLPWHHAAGAFVMRAVLLEGGTLYIDDGKPTPALFKESLRNLREIPVSYYNNVPLGYGMLADAIEADPELSKTFYSRMRLMLYGGAGLSQPVYDRIQQAAVRETGHRIMFTSGYGATETVSAFMLIHFETDDVGIGLPTPGSKIKLVPQGDRYELRVKGPNVTAGYLDEPEKTASAFDEEGYYITGDLAVFHDEDRPEKGLAFAGRAVEEFKLSSGGWVYGGALRDKLLKALAPDVMDVVLCDENRPYLAMLLWTNREVSPESLRDRLRAFNETQRGGASRIMRALVLTDPPDPNAHEMSDKGTVNRRAVIDRRTADVDRLFAEKPDEEIIIVE
ncbi:AMP-binding protein [Hyphococcus sp. DH-69]|uniref:AMP-binding protein n=1 Tax=Hyphococcus formosus TaxID=3143534 RepID=UPI00398B793C